MTEQSKLGEMVDKMIATGAHFGFGRSRRHASAKPFILTNKNGTDVIDLSKTNEQVKKAITFVEELGKGKKVLLFVGTKPEAKIAIKSVAMSLNMPYVTERWVGGLLTNWNEMKKRIARRAELISKKERNELEKYTKKERLLLDRELDGLEVLFGGVSTMLKTPDALFVIDPRKESIAIEEASKMGVPVISLLNTDCSSQNIAYPIIANDASRKSVSFFIDTIRDAYQSGSNA